AERGVGDLLDEGMGLAVSDGISLLDGGTADGLGEMALTRPRWSEEEHVLALADEARGGQLVDQGAAHLLVEIEVETVEGAVRIAEAGLLGAALEESVLSAQELVGDEGRDEVDGRRLFGLGLAKARVQDVGHAGEPELAQRVIEFDEVHVGSPVLWSMRSR